MNLPGNSHGPMVIEFFRAPRGAGIFADFFKCSRSFLKASKAPFPTLGIAPPHREDTVKHCLKWLSNLSESSGLNRHWSLQRTVHLLSIGRSKALPLPVVGLVLNPGFRAVCWRTRSNIPRWLQGQALLKGGGNGTGRWVCDICVPRVCTHARHTNQTHASPQATLLCQNQRSLRHQRVMCLTQTESTNPPLTPPH